MNEYDYIESRSELQEAGRYRSPAPISILPIT